ncbi:MULTISPECIES: DUF4230 domain-containing protein [unclassified Oceanispirochaeta]|uniref:DUF4230 domain-containing protein n=1 Tax=unclassified Oceanispirochaeta TaxID=2635722 RepID=UPI000E090E46|nr:MULTISPECIES: DUF4230 domain-containing protein [unclassified Oceanispirochaeta]MBF9015493.1 DUF4230 domain-containing protein [Oceanispirochaeta sp. M2]NPD71952.1 DUF4230 domain-containing protein [Oceanispirochaeta sp. M1]RDG32759.1 DUF4230 domain-containing protein [Oceanispirochaeta sp. M1]
MTVRKKKSSPSKITLPALCLLILLLALPLSVLYLTRQKEQKRVSEIRGQLEQLGELVTVTQLYRSVFYTREKKNFIQDKSILFTAEFIVQAGVDLSEGFDLSVKGGQARLILPPGRIFLVDADDTSFRQILIKEKFSSINTGDFLPLVSEEADSIEEQAVNQGLPAAAEDKAVILMKGILRAAGVDNIQVVFRERAGI